MMPFRDYCVRRAVSVYIADEHIENPAPRASLRSVIRFPNVGKTKPADVRRGICEVRGEIGVDGRDFSTKPVKMFVMNNELGDHLWSLTIRREKSTRNLKKTFTRFSSNFSFASPVKSCRKNGIRENRGHVGCYDTRFCKAARFYDDGIRRLVPRHDK